MKWSMLYSFTVLEPQTSRHMAFRVLWYISKKINYLLRNLMVQVVLHTYVWNCVQELSQGVSADSREPYRFYRCNVNLWKKLRFFLNALGISKCVSIILQFKKSCAPDLFGPCFVPVCVQKITHKRVNCI